MTDHQVMAMISTKGRVHTTLPLVLNAIAMQTVRPTWIVVYCDDEKWEDPRQTNPLYNHLFCLLQQKGITWFFEPGQRKGQHFNHQHSQNREQAKDLIWRIDDDSVPEPDVLEKLLSHFQVPEVGAVGGLILNPQSDTSIIPSICSGKLADIDTSANFQWFRHPSKELVEVEHLHCSFLYKARVAEYDLRLSPAAHREETIFTYNIKRAGFKLFVDPEATTWHLRFPTGGIRAHEAHPEYWKADDEIFKGLLKEWKVEENEPSKMVVLDCGLGDTLTFYKAVFQELKRKYGKKLVISACYPEVFENDDVKIISIAEAGTITDIGPFNIYGRMFEWSNQGWRGSLAEAFRRLYLYK